MHILSYQVHEVRSMDKIKIFRATAGFYTTTSTMQKKLMVLLLGKYGN
jgi:hypothetical protein